MTSFAIFFFIGAFIASHKNKNHFEILRTKVPKYVSLLFLLLFLLIFPLIRQSLGLIVSKTWYDPISLFIICSLFILIITKPEDFFILRIKPLIFMSEISYGFYLVHRPLMKITRDELGTRPLAMFILFAVCVIVAWLSFKLVEVPARKYIESRFNSQSKLIKA
jgi:peptidoglycan/LPS O-acetylase OafA/YrhL